MSNLLLGTIDGDLVRLDDTPPLPDGARVEVTITAVPTRRRHRPRVGETTGPQFNVPDEALAPLTDDELKTWGLS